MPISAIAMIAAIVSSFFWPAPDVKAEAMKAVFTPKLESTQKVKTVQSHEMTAGVVFGSTGTIIVADYGRACEADICGKSPVTGK